MSCYLRKDLKRAFYDAKRQEEGGPDKLEFWCYMVPMSASVTERNASLCLLIFKIAWMMRNLCYSDYFIRNEAEEIIGIISDENPTVMADLDCVMEYIKRGWLPADQSKWDDLAYKLMDEDTDNVFSEPC